MNIDWNVKEYLKDFAFVPKYGEAVETLRPVLYHDGHWYVDYVRIRIKAVEEEK